MTRRVCSIGMTFVFVLNISIDAENPPPTCSGTPTHKFAVQVSLDGGSTWLSNSATMYLLPNQQRSIMARTLMTTTTGQTQGWSFGLVYDNSNQSYYGGSTSITAVTTAGTQTATVQNGGSPDTLSTAIRAGYKGFTQGVVIDTDQVYTLSPTTNFVTSKACYNIVAGSNIATYRVYLKFVHDIGNPRIRSVITQNSRSIIPCAQNFTLDVSVNNYQSTSGGCSISGSGPMGGGMESEGGIAGGAEVMSSSCPVYIRRADSDNNGQLNITDAIKTLNHLFQADTAPPCLIQADANADNMIDVSDAIFTLSYLFLGSPGLLLAEGCGHAFGDLSCDNPSCPAPQPSLSGSDPDDQSEAAVAINPTDPDNVVVVCNRWAGAGLFRFVTTNGGITWNSHDPNDKLILEEQGGVASDSALAFDKFGNLFLAYQNNSLGPQDRGFYVAVSIDKGFTFTRFQQRLLAAADRSAIATGPHATDPALSTVWLCTRNEPSLVVLAATVDGLLGAAELPQFSAAKEVTNCLTSPPAPNSNRDCDCNYCDIAVGPNGEVMVAYNNGTHVGPHARPVTVFVKMRLAVAPPGPQAQDTEIFQLKTTLSSNVCAIANLDQPFDFIPARPEAAKGIVAAPELAWDHSRDKRVFMVFTTKSELAGGIVGAGGALIKNLNIDCGGVGITGLWESDEANQTGQAVNITATLDTTGLVDPAPAQIYSTARRSTGGLSHQYSIPSAINGKYRVRIHIAHVTQLGANPVSDVFIENQLVGRLNGIVDAVEPNKVAIRELPASVTDGNGMEILCTPINGGQAYELGIEVIGENHDTEVHLVSAVPGSDPNNTYATWSSPIRVNADSITAGNSQFFPKVAVDQATGLVAVCWYDTRPIDDVSPQNLRKVRLFARYSTDGGLTFSVPDFPVSCEASDGAAAPVDQSRLGDYIGVDFLDKALFPVWGDNSADNDNTEVHSKRVLVP